MSVVVVNVSSGSTTTTLPLISSVPGGIITIKDSGSASVSNTITIVPTSGNTFQIGTYVINTPLGYITFLGFGTSWRVIATSYPNIPIYTSTISTVSGVIGPANATLNTLTVAAQTTLANTSNTGTLVVAGAATFSNTTFGGFTGGAGTSFGIPNTLTIGNDSSTGFFNGSGISYGTGRYAYLRHNLGNVYGYLLADYGFLPDTWNMTYNAYTSNGAWVIPNATIGTTRFQITSSNFVWLYGASNVAPTTTAMTLNNGGLSVSGSLYMSLGAVGIGVVSAQSFTTEANIENNLNNAPTNGMGKTIGFPGLSTYSGSNQQPLQITGYYGINFVGGTGNWITGASHMSIVDGKVGIQRKNPQYTLDVSGNINVTGDATLGKYSTFLCFNNGTGYDSVKHITGNSSGFLLSDNALLGDSWNLSYNAYASNSAWAIQNSGLPTSRFLLRGAQFEWYYGGTNAAPTSLAMTLNSAGLYVYSNIYLPIGTSGVGISAQSFTTTANIGDMINNAPSYGMGATSGFAGLGPYSGANQPIQIASYYGINFVGGVSGWAPGASSMCIVDGKVGIGTRNPTASLEVNGNVNVGIPNTGREFSIYSTFSSEFGMRMWTDGNGTSHLKYNFGTLYIIDNNGTGVYLARGSTSWVAYSDERLKENIIPITNALDFCASIRTVKYSHVRENLSTPNKIGFIAQDFVNDYPEVINIDRDDKLGLAYTETIPIAVAAIKEQKIIVDAQASTIRGLQTHSLTQSSTITGLQINAEAQTSTITGLQTTITAILEKYPL